MTSIAIGLASGIGNAVFMLPAIKALKEKGAHVALYVQTDFATADLWRRCRYADQVLEAPQSINGHVPICGQWRPASWNRISKVVQVQLRHPYTMPEWKSNLRLACQTERVDVSDWCRDLDRTPRWDVGIVPGSKGGVWLRKRWPGMRAVAAHYLAAGRRVAVFGTQDDGAREIPGETVLTPAISTLPDALAGCRVIIGTDSGVTHLASSLGVPVVVVYTATSEVKGEPVGRAHTKILAPLACRPCQTTPRWAACGRWACQDLDSAAVVSAADNYLGNI